MTMSRSLVLPLLLCSACSLFGKSNDTAAPEPEPVISQESKDTARAGDAAALAQIQQMDAQIEQNEAKLRTALEAALGTAPPFPGGQAPPPASETMAKLREAKIDLYITPVLDHTGKPVASGFVELKDSYTDKVQVLGRKMAEGKASKKEQKFVQDGAKHVMALNDLKAQVRAAVDPAMNAGWMVTTGSMTTMQMTANMIKTRRHMEMEWTDEDYALVQQLLSSQQRREAVAAISIGLMGAYQVAVADGGDPTVIDQVAQATLDALPMKGEATLEEAKAYVDNFEQNVESAHVQYEDMMRKTWGDEEYEAKYKAQIDNMFTQAAAATSTQSVTEMMAANNAKYEEHLKMCARGEEPPSDTMVGPAKCKEAKAAASGGQLSPDALAQLVGGVGDVDAKGMAKKGILLALDKIPGGKQVKRAIEGVKALRDGDPSVALRLAADLVPMPGPAKMALNGAASIAEALPKAKRNARRMRG
jgi:polyhydroxyalkanoate synthesis regulator phasin